MVREYSISYQHPLEDDNRSRIDLNTAALSTGATEHLLSYPIFLNATSCMGAHSAIISVFVSARTCSSKYHILMLQVPTSMHLQY